MNVSKALTMVAACAALTCAADGERRPKALMLFFDGVRADFLANADCPNLKALAEGTWAEGYGCAWSDCAQNLTDAPTLSYPNHTSLLTGVVASRHHVLNNDDILSVKVGWPTWLKRVRLARPDLTAHAFYADGVDALVTRDPLVPVTNPDHLPWWEKDAALTRMAVERLSQEEIPDLLTFFQEATDCYGHFCGYYPASRENLEALHAADANLGRVLAAIKSRKAFKDEDWLITFCPDHGGKFLGHGPDDASCHTIPMLVVGRNVGRGRMTGCPRICDVPVTLMAHFGVTGGKDNLDGRVIGAEVVAETSRGLSDGLVAACSFDEPLVSTLAAATNKVQSGFSAWGYAERVRTGVATDAASRPASPTCGLSLGRQACAAFRLEGSGKLIPSEKAAFTLAFWVLDEGKYGSGNPILVSNRNEYDPMNAGFSNRTSYPGFSIFLKSRMSDATEGVTLEYALRDGKTVRRVGAFLPEFGKWTFYAVVVRADGPVVFYQGRSDGRFHWIAGDATDANFASGLPILLGQDASGQYAYAADLGFDEFRFWNRALTAKEVRQVFGRSETK